MNSLPRFKFLLPALLAGATLTSSALAAKDVTIKKGDKPDSTLTITLNDDALGEKETVPYLGIETAPVGRTLGRQLGLPRDVGLVVVRIAKNSPAEAVLKEDDILLRLDDQILVDSRQLSVLIRSRKEGDEVTLTVRREGRELTAKAKLAKREVPRMADTLRLIPGGPGNSFEFFNKEITPGLDGLAHLRELPGLEREDLNNVMRMLEHQRGALFSGPRMHVIRRGGSGATILDLPKGNFVYSDDAGTVEFKGESDKRQLMVKDAKGNVTFDGPVVTEEERRKIPAEVLTRLEKIDLSFELGEDFKQEGAAVGDPAKQKISEKLGRSFRSLRALRSLRSF